MNITHVIKHAMNAAGYTVSESEGWTIKDGLKFYDFAHFKLGVSSAIAHRVLQFPQQFEALLAPLVSAYEATKAPASTAPLTKPIVASVAPESVENAESKAVPVDKDVINISGE